VLRRVYAHRVHVGDVNQFAISAPESGISASFPSESEFQEALDKLGFPAGYGPEVVRSLQARGIVWLDLDENVDLEILKGLGQATRRP